MVGVGVHVRIGVDASAAEHGRRLQPLDVLGRMDAVNRVQGRRRTRYGQHAGQDTVCLEQIPRALEAPVVLWVAIQRVFQIERVVYVGSFVHRQAANKVQTTANSGRK